MTTIERSRLNEGQTAAAEGFFEFLFSPHKELIISGPGGTGKTHLMSAMIDQIMPRYFETCKLMSMDPKYDAVEMTATTNKAAEVLAVATQRPTSTIHSLLNLKVQDDFKTGESKLTRTGAWKPHQRKIIFIDECSMIDSPLRAEILGGCLNCKIVYVGDHCQLAPVTETISPIYRANLPFFELTEQMRTNDVDLQALNLQMRHTVETGEFYPIQVVPGVIDWMDDETMQATVDEAFATQTHDTRILAYTNAQVNLFNDHIRVIRNLPPSYTVGENLINNAAIRIGGKMLSVEAEVELIRQASDTSIIELAPQAELEVRMSDLRAMSGEVYRDVPIPEDRDHFLALSKYFSKKKDWERYFNMKGTYPDLRPRDASTVHKSQGSTYDSVFIDLGNISTCHQPNAVARMLYVAFSRARTRVFLYGELAEKYGGLIH